MGGVSMPFRRGDKNINRNGAPKRNWTWSGVLAKAVDEKAKDGKPIKVHIARSLLAEALKGNVIATKEIMNRMDGMPNQLTELTGDVSINIDGALKK